MVDSTVYWEGAASIAGGIALAVIGRFVGLWLGNATSSTLLGPVVLLFGIVLGLVAGANLALRGIALVVDAVVEERLAEA